MIAAAFLLRSVALSTVPDLFSGSHRSTGRLTPCARPSIEQVYPIRRNAGCNPRANLWRISTVGDDQERIGAREIEAQVHEAIVAPRLDKFDGGME